MIFGEYRNVDQTIADLQKVTVESLNAFLKKYFDIQRAGAILIGDVNEERGTRYLKRNLG
jgi:predicted Zn-dependent peptidase